MSELPHWWTGPGEGEGWELEVGDGFLCDSTGKGLIPVQVISDEVDHDDPGKRFHYVTAWLRVSPTAAREMAAKLLLSAHQAEAAKRHAEAPGSMLTREQLAGTVPGGKYPDRAPDQPEK